jgi:FkbM family methyltransferase
MLFPAAKFFLVDAIASRYDAASRQHYVESHANFRVIEATLADRPGRASFRVSADLYNSSLVCVGSAAREERVLDAKLTTLDLLAGQFGIAGRGLLKIDAQHAEHLILTGGQNLVERQIDVVVLELSLYRVHKEAKTLTEMIECMAGLGFRYFDDAGNWRNASTGVLEEKDVVFVRNGLFLSESEAEQPISALGQGSPEAGQSQGVL